MSAARKDLRLSDAERQEALDALSEHVGTGRIDLDEYRDRSAQVTAVKTQRELIGLFDDLPAPTPSFLEPGHESTARNNAENRRQPTRTERFTIRTIALLAIAGATLLIIFGRMPILVPLLLAIALLIRLKFDRRNKT